MQQRSKTLLYYAGALFLIIVSVLAIAVTIYVTKGNQRYDENTISVSASAEAYAVPDIAKFSFEVRETAKEPQQAQEVISEKVGNILDGLEALGVSDKDIKTESYTITPKYEWVKTKQKVEQSPEGIIYYPDEESKRILTGYTVSQRVTVKLRDLEKVPQALELFAKYGVENLRGPEFAIEDIDAVKEKARLEAIQKAKEKAKRLAKELDVKLGKLVSFRENSGGYVPYRAPVITMNVMDGAGKNFAPELPAGENEVSSQVTLVYTIK